MSADHPRWTGLAGELHELGHALDIPEREPDVVADQVMTRLSVADRGVRTRRWRPALAAAIAILVVLALTPPVRATVADWIGVVITPAEPAGSATVPDAAGSLSLQEATDLLPFDPVVPDHLVDAYGRPDGVEMSDDRRVLSLSWTTPDGTIRLDQFDGQMAPVFLKQAEHEEITVAGEPAIWISNAHFLSPLDPAGRQYSSLVRAAEPTLIWRMRDVTLRLEGLDRTSAIAVAESSAGTR